METLIHLISQNPIVAGLSTTAILGGAMFQFRRLPAIIGAILLRNFSVKLTVDNRDQAFIWIDKWLSTLSYAESASVVTLRSNNLSPDILAKGNSDGHWILSPGQGIHWFWWNNRFVIVKRSFVDSKESGNAPVEQMEFRIIGSSQQIIKNMIRHAHSLSVKRDLVSLQIWRKWWVPSSGKTPRSLDTVILKRGQRERILEDFAWFVDAKEWYVKRGIPYRRGYLFSGPPGTGKTSIVLAIAGHFNRVVCALNLGSLESDDALFGAISEAPKDAIILIEDIDCASPSHNRKISDKSENANPSQSIESMGVTKAGLLNALDGITIPDGRIFIMTTNYPDRLDAALIRPGRVDVHETLGYMGRDEQIEMALRFYGPSNFEPLDGDVSPANLQAAFMRFANDPLKARDALAHQYRELIR